MGPSHLSLKWTARYHGPNPLADSSLVVAELTADSLSDVAQLEHASATLWGQSGMHQETVEEHANKRTDDGLLAVGEMASQWALAALNEVRGDVRHAGAVRDGEVVRLWVGFHHPKVSRAALELAVRALVQRINGPGDPQELGAELSQLWKACRVHHPDFQARILRLAAREMDVPYLPFLPGNRYWQFGWGAKALVFMETSSNADGTLGSQWQKNKATSKELMKAMGFPVPAHVLVSRAQDLPTAVARIGFPCAVKPLDSGGGQGVTADIKSVADAQTAFQFASQYTKGPVLVESHIPGYDHRLTVIDGQLISAIRREPSFVVGDGQRSLSVLVAHLNAPRSSNIVRSRYLRPVAMDDVLVRHLATQALTLEHVPVIGQRVTLRSNANLSTGGMCTDLTAVCHPQVRAMAEQLAKTTGLRALGIDYLTTDISGAPSLTGGAFIEMNASPGLDVCVASGWSETAIGRKVLGESVSRIPIDLTLLSASGMGQLQLAFQNHLVAQDAAVVIGDALHIGELTLNFKSTEPWPAVNASLRNRGVRRVQVICTADAVHRFGFPVDRLQSVAVAVCDGEPVLSPDWTAVLNRVAQSDVAFESEPAILDRLLNARSDPLT